MYTRGGFCCTRGGTRCCVHAGESKRDNRYSLCALEEARCAFSDGIEFKCVSTKTIRFVPRIAVAIVSSHCVEIFDNFILLMLKQLPIITQFIFESFIVYGAATSIALIAALVSNFF